MKTIRQAAALFLAAIIICTVLFGALEVAVLAAAPEVDSGSMKIYSSNGAEILRGRLSAPTRGAKVVFEYTHDKITTSHKGLMTNVKFTIPSSGAFKETSSTKVALEARIDDNGGAYVEVTISNIDYVGPKSNTDLLVNITEATTAAGSAYDPVNLAVSIPSYYLDSNSSSGGDDDPDTNPYSSDIIIENVLVRDSAGNLVDKVTKDTERFSLEIVFLDYGLREVDEDQFDRDSLEVYLTSFGGFVPAGGARGTLVKSLNSPNDAPRFRATFQNVTWKGGSNTVTFRAQYDVHGWEVTGEQNATVHQADSEEEDKLAPLVPHIIVNQYSYGGGQIAAGDSFTLNMTMKNTSKDIPLENIIMTITPYIPENNTGSTSGGLTITSASNTYYVESLEVGETFTHSIDLRAEPSAAVGSHKINIEFSFQYVDEVHKERKESKDTESVAIPVTQIDRFSVDPLTEVPDILMAGEEGYITVTFINRGKSTTYNISGVINGEGLAVPGASVHHGNLESGKNGSLEFEVLYLEVGQRTGEIVVSYEDENANEQEVTVPFSIFVEQPFYPEPPPPDTEGPETEEPGGLNVFRLALLVIGGVLIAVPLMLYMSKRVKAKGSEDFDEIF